MSMAGIDSRRAFLTMGATYQTVMVVRSKATESQKAADLTPVGRLRGGSDWIWSKNGPKPGDIGGDVAAVFDLAAFRALPSRDVEVVVFTTNAGERRCKISEKERKAIR
jgi:hypothetical protein